PSCLGLLRLFCSRGGVRPRHLFTLAFGCLLFLGLLFPLCGSPFGCLLHVSFGGFWEDLQACELNSNGLGRHIARIWGTVIVAHRIPDHECNVPRFFAPDEGDNCWLAILGNKLLDLLYGHWSFLL